MLAWSEYWGRLEEMGRSMINTNVRNEVLTTFFFISTQLTTSLISHNVFKVQFKYISRNTIVEKFIMNHIIYQDEGYGSMKDNG